MRLRPPLDADVPEIAALLNAVSERAWGAPDTTDAQIRLSLSAPGVDPERDARVADEDGRIVGYVHVEPTESTPVRNWCLVRVHPDADAAAVGRELLAWADERAGAGIVRAWGPSAATELIAAFERAGMSLVRHAYRMQIDLAAEPPPPAWPEGVAVRTFRPGDERSAYEAQQETFEDTWEHHREPFEAWSHWFAGLEDFDPSLWYLAEADGALAGILLSMPKDGEQGTGLVHILGVRREWRRRGLGRALLEHSFREFHRRGYERVILGVDASSLTGAQRLYESAGMRVVRRFDFYEKTL